MPLVKDSVIVVTGAGRGIGREIALLAARKGASVVVNDFGGSPDGDALTSDPAADVVEEIRSAGGRAVANRADISDPAQADGIITDAVSAFGKVDSLVNNAGILRDRIFHKMSVDDWNYVVNVNLTGYFNVSKAAALQFKEQGYGSFVHFTSTSGLIGNFGQANYSAAKMGVVGLSNSIALDMQRYGVRSNCIAPFAWSRMTATIPADSEAEKQRVERFKTMTPDKIAPLAVALCGDEAGDVSGQIFCVRRNEIFLFSPPRPIRSLHRSEGWTLESITSDLIPGMRASFSPLARSSDVFAWDPV